MADRVPGNDFYKRLIMNLLIWIIAGSIVGAITGTVMYLLKRAQGKELVINMVTGAAGALVGGSLLAPIFGTGSINPQHYSNAKMLVAIASALVLLIIVNIFDQFNKH